MWEEFDGAGYALGSGLGDITLIAAVMFGGMSNIPALNTVRCPRSSDLRGFMDEDFGAGWRHGRFIEVEGAIHMGFGGELGVCVGAAKEVEGCGRLVDQAIPQVQWKSWVGTG